MKRFLERVKKIAVTSFSAKWWNPVYWVLGLLTLCVSVTLGLCWAGVAFVSGCIQGWNDFRSVVWGQ